MRPQPEGRETLPQPGLRSVPAAGELLHAQAAVAVPVFASEDILCLGNRAGVFELMERTDVPARVSINEYINVAHSFFSDDEPKVVNGVLDKLGRQLRAAEFERNGAR